MLDDVFLTIIVSGATGQSILWVIYISSLTGGNSLFSFYLELLTATDDLAMATFNRSTELVLDGLGMFCLLSNPWGFSISSERRSKNFFLKSWTFVFAFCYISILFQISTELTWIFGVYYYFIGILLVTLLTPPFVALASNRREKSILLSLSFTPYSFLFTGVKFDDLTNLSILL